MDGIAVIARWITRPEAADRVGALAKQLAVASAAESGCISFEVLSKGDDAFVAIERYESLEAFAAHRETEHFAAIMAAQIAPLLESRVVEVWSGGVLLAP